MIPDKQFAVDLFDYVLDTEFNHHAHRKIYDVHPFHWNEGIRYTSGSGTGGNWSYSSNSLILCDVNMVHTWALGQNIVFEATLNGKEVAFLDDDVFEDVNNGGGGQENVNIIKNVENYFLNEVVCDAFSFTVPDNITNITGADVIGAVTLIGWEVLYR